MKKDLFFSRSIMNGATLFGVGVTLLAMTLALNTLGEVKPIGLLFLYLTSLLYLVCSILAFFFPKLSE